MLSSQKSEVKVRLFADAINNAKRFTRIATKAVSSFGTTYALVVCIVASAFCATVLNGCLSNLSCFPDTSSAGFTIALPAVFGISIIAAAFSHRARARLVFWRRKR